ncbi:MAG TPA: hypothetical protein DD391_10760 [Clostridiales bacterium]|nr:hypothetical protein [Clostridiales bacterium]HBL83044.1 hypothetical protein [Clostridiales bacterium]
MPVTALWHKRVFAVPKGVCCKSRQLRWYRGNFSRPQVYPEDGFFYFKTTSRDEGPFFRSPVARKGRNYNGEKGT